MSDKILTTHSVIANNLGAIHDKIAAAQRACKVQMGLDRPVTLVAVSKRQPDDHIDAALAAGQMQKDARRPREHGYD